jgi:hypothetical protein
VLQVFLLRLLSHRDRLAAVADGDFLLALLLRANLVVARIALLFVRIPIVLFSVIPLALCLHRLRKQVQHSAERAAGKAAGQLPSRGLPRQ